MAAAPMALYNRRGIGIPPAGLPAALADPNQPLDNSPGGAAPIDPTTGLPSSVPPAGFDPSGGFTPSTLPGPAGAPVPAYNVPGATGNITGTTSPGQMTSQNRIYAATTGGDIMANIGSQMGYYGGLQEQYRQAADQAYQQLAKTPGYTPGEAGQINVDYSQFNTPESALQQRQLTPQEQAAITGDPNAPVSALQGGLDAEGKMLNQYQSGVGQQLQAYQGDLSGQVSNYGAGVGGAATDLGKGLTKAQGGFSKLDTAVNQPGLGFDPNATEKQLTDADVQEMKTAAGTRIGNQYQTAEDQLQRQAAAAGNTSPLAIAAANARLQSQEAADQGDAEVNADIAAKQAQFQRAQGIEAQREGAVQTQAGMQAGAATTEEAAAQAAAGLAGTQDIYAQEAIGQQGVNAANTYNQAALNQIGNYGQFSTNVAGQMAGQQYGAALTAEQEAQQRAQAIAQNRQATTADIQNTQYGQGTGSAQMTSQGAQAVGQARQQGLSQYRNYLTGQQGTSQTGAQTAQGQQIDAFKGTTSAMGGAAQTQEANKNAPTVGGQILGGVIGNLTRPPGGKEGDIVENPELRTIGEDGPELVVPIRPRYGERRKAA